MKSRTIAALCGILIFSSLIASPVFYPREGARSLPMTGEFDVVVVYALGQWNNSDSTVEHQQNTPRGKDNILMKILTSR
jgi:hypothetical protein